MTEPQDTDPPARRVDPLVIKRIDYLGPMASAGGWRPEARLPEVAFSGRSNVGKSSLINRLTRRKKLARVSHTPGRTREIHFFQVNDQFTLVDLPGYGYAKISKTRQAEWRPLIEGYLRTSAPLAGVVQLLDSRHDPTPDDHQVLDFLADVGVPTLIVLTKTDKLPRSQIAGRIAAIASQVGLDTEQCLPFSAETGLGRDELAEAVVQLIAAPPWRELGGDGAAPEQTGDRDGPDEAL